MTALPWGIYTTDTFDLKRAKEVLDAEHYGLKDVKDRILELIAVGSFTKNINGKIICLVGPPGTGKTSIGHSIAKAISRKFFRFSVGGLNDVAEIKGHRRTYVGAMPGKVIQCLKQLGTSNPVILIDEIDKLSVSVWGDPAAALLEILDPEQNVAFYDYYLDVPFDLSKVLFICTANRTDTIPKTLLDRMEVIELTGYTLEEKLHIAKKHLIVKARERTGLKASQLVITEPTIRWLIQGWCQEMGVRELQRQINLIFDKVALNLQREIELKHPTNRTSTGTTSKDSISSRPTPKNEENRTGNKFVLPKISITTKNLVEYVGEPKFSSKRYYDVCPPGVVMGILWDPIRSSVVYVETVSERIQSIEMEESEKNEETGIQRTGSMGSIMEESSEIAFFYARNFLHQIDPSNNYFLKHKIHMHTPEGHITKNDSTFGVTMVTALLSLATKKPVMSNMAITGEITLCGKVLPVTKLKEMVIAAKQADVKYIIFPEGNRSSVRSRLTIVVARETSMFALY
jgi:Lon-like ATP-dependent protease